MKNLTRRSKRLLAIAAVVVVVVVAGLVIFAPGDLGLFGGDIIHISPENPTIIVGQSINLSINSVSNCTWSSSVAGIVNISNYNSSGDRNITVQGAKAGATSIKANCISNHYTTVTVIPGPTATPIPVPPVITIGPDTGKGTPTIGFNEKLTLCTGDPSVQWTVTSVTPSSSSHVLDLAGSMYGPGCALVTGINSGTADVRATNAGGGSAAVRVGVDGLFTMTPAYPTIAVGQSINMTMTSALSNTQWSIARGCEDVPAETCHVQLSSNKGQSVTITGHVAGCAVITAFGPYAPGGLTTVCVR